MIGTSQAPMLPDRLRRHSHHRRGTPGRPQAKPARQLEIGARRRDVETSAKTVSN
jgi:hypothetical protein